MRRVSKHAGVLLGLAILVASLPAQANSPRLPRPAHVVVVVEENRSFSEIIGSPSAPYFTQLVKRGALFTNSHGVTHPSLPNYLAMFAGLTNDNGDFCPETGVPVNAPNLASEAMKAGFTFVGYAESMPSVGYKGCSAGMYARKHAPWVEFSNVPASQSRPLSTLRGWDQLPTISFIIPDGDDDMHDGTEEQGDDWFKQHLDSLVTWANAHNALVVLTWDEGFDPENHIATAFFGPMVKPGRYPERITHYTLLRTLEDLYGLPHAGRSGAAAPIVDVWR